MCVCVCVCKSGLSTKFNDEVTSKSLGNISVEGACAVREVNLLEDSVVLVPKLVLEDLGDLLWLVPIGTAAEMTEKINDLKE